MYNPLAKRSLAKSIRSEFLSRPMQPWPTERFLGAGVYALYYLGKDMPFDLYERIKVSDLDDALAVPIYVGRAVPRGTRSGTIDLDAGPGADLYGRLVIHKRSIEEAVNLSATDFVSRYLIVDDIWVPLAESLLITEFAPLWNQAVSGFGIKTPGAGRANQKRSAWDVLHPGRSFADNLSDSDRSKDDIRQKIISHLDTYFDNTSPLSAL